MLDKLIDFLLQSLQLFQLYHFIPAYQRGVVLRFGKFHRLAEPGWLWVWPLRFEHVVTTNIQPEVIIVGPQSLTTADGHRIVISALFIIRVTDPKTFLLELEGGVGSISLIGQAAIAKFVESRNLHELYSRNDDILTPSRKLETVMRHKVLEFGVLVSDAQICELSETRSLRLFTK